MRTTELSFDGHQDLLKSDLITSDKMLNINGIELVKLENKLFHYIDNRELTVKN